MSDVGGYHLERQIGAGSTGTVWKAVRQGPIPQPVALKRLRVAGGSVDVERLRREASLLAELDHPHIIRVVEIIEDGDGVAVAMQHAPGGSLEAVLAERGRLSPGQVVAVAVPLAGALTSAHRRGTVHGDVKPANVLFTSDGEPLLSDFGSARSLGLLTSENLAATPEYVAPELLDGATPDERADIYSLGVVCYQALTGSPPYAGATPLAVVRAADAGDHEPLTRQEGVPAPLADAVEQAMARDPRDRFDTANAFAQALRGAVPSDSVHLPGIATADAAPDGGEASDAGGTGGTRTFGPRPPRPEPEPERRRVRVPGTLVVAGLVAFGALWLLRGPLSAGDGGCPDVARPQAGPGAQVVSGDPDGTGCEVYGLYEPAPPQQEGAAMVFRIHLDGEESAPIGLGAPGDQVLLGDWDCDGVDTLAHYLRAEGAVHYYDRWPTPAQPRLDPVRAEEAPPDGQASLDPAPGDTGDAGEAPDEGGDGQRCDRVEVTPDGDGGTIDPGSTETVAGPTRFW